MGLQTNCGCEFAVEEMCCMCIWEEENEDQKRAKYNSNSGVEGNVDGVEDRKRVVGLSWK